MPAVCAMSWSTCCVSREQWGNTCEGFSQFAEPEAVLEVCCHADQAEVEVGQGVLSVLQAVGELGHVAHQVPLTKHAPTQQGGDHLHTHTHTHMQTLMSMTPLQGLQAVKNRGEGRVIPQKRFEASRAPAGDLALRVSQLLSAVHRNQS